jgi:glycyl-tRNA synthetase beta subunit
MRLREFTTIKEINDDNELTVSQRIQDYFFNKGYRYAGEGRDQLAFSSPRNTIVKVLGTGDPGREKIVRDYVEFFVQNQQNPYYPRIYNTGEFTINDETYYVYEMEYLKYISNEEEVLEYIEDLMKSLAVNGQRGVNAFHQNRPLPKSLPEEEVAGLVKATFELEQHLGGQASLDLSMIENLRRRDNGQIVIMDPYSL